MKNRQRALVSDEWLALYSEYASWWCPPALNAWWWVIRQRSAKTWQWPHCWTALGWTKNADVGICYGDLDFQRHANRWTKVDARLNRTTTQPADPLCGKTLLSDYWRRGNADPDGCMQHSVDCFITRRSEGERCCAGDCDWYASQRVKCIGSKWTRWKLLWNRTDHQHQRNATTKPDETGLWRTLLSTEQCCRQKIVFHRLWAWCHFPTTEDEFKQQNWRY